MQITSSAAGPSPALSLAGPVEMVEAAGARIAVARRGVPAADGAPLLCLHAIGHGSGDFGPLADRLARDGARIALAAIDWPGHGQSPADGRPAEAARHAEILEALVPELFGGRAPVVLGNSIGGAAAILAAARSPGLLAGLVLCNPGGLAAVDAPARAFCGAMAAFFRAGARGAWWYPSLFGAYYRVVLPLAPERRAGIVAAARASAPALAEAWASFGRAESDLRGALARVTAPLLFAWAQDDRIVSWARSRAAVEGTGAPVHLLAGGHAPFLEDPDRFALLLQAAVEAWAPIDRGPTGG